LEIYLEFDMIEHAAKETLKLLKEEIQSQQQQKQQKQQNTNNNNNTYRWTKLTEETFYHVALLIQTLETNISKQRTTFNAILPYFEINTNTTSKKFENQMMQEKLLLERLKSTQLELKNELESFVNQRKY